MPGEHVMFSVMDSVQSAQCIGSRTVERKVVKTKRIQTETD